MSGLVDITQFPVSQVLDQLLKDRTTGENILFATDAYEELSPEFGEKCQIQADMLTSGRLKICPRVEKEFEQQRMRQRAKAEVFTPSWIVNKMNNHCDEEWFGESGVFNQETETGWVVNTKLVHFRRGLSWKKYVDSRRLEITCGEAPYLVSRYDTVTGRIIPVAERIGILDRKLRIVTEKTKTEEEWLEWSIRAFKSVYGYEFQGDNLLIARINLLLTFCEYIYDRWGRTPADEEVGDITDVIVWNVWQMDGLTKLIPYKTLPETRQFDLFCSNEALITFDDGCCKTFDWRRGVEEYIY